MLLILFNINHLFTESEVVLLFNTNYFIEHYSFTQSQMIPSIAM